MLILMWSGCDKKFNFVTKCWHNGRIGLIQLFIYFLLLCESNKLLELPLYLSDIWQQQMCPLAIMTNSRPILFLHRVWWVWWVYSTCTDSYLLSLTNLLLPWTTTWVLPRMDNYLHVVLVTHTCYIYLIKAAHYYSRLV